MELYNTDDEMHLRLDKPVHHQDGQSILLKRYAESVLLIHAVEKATRLSKVKKEEILTHLRKTKDDNEELWVEALLSSNAEPKNSFSLFSSLSRPLSKHEEDEARWPVLDEENQERAISCFFEWIEPPFKDKKPNDDLFKSFMTFYNKNFSVENQLPRNAIPLEAFLAKKDKYIAS